LSESPPLSPYSLDLYTLIQIRDLSMVCDEQHNFINPIHSLISTKFSFQCNDRSSFSLCYIFTAYTLAYRLCTRIQSSSYPLLFPQQSHVQSRIV